VRTAVRKKIVIPILVILCLGMLLIFSFQSKLTLQPESSFPDEPQITEGAKSSVTTRRKSSAVSPLQSADGPAELPLIPVIGKSGWRSLTIFDLRMEYGHMFFRVLGHNGTFNLKSFLNPSGSQNSEFDPKLQ
jgi:hypothetical protein